MDFLNNTFEICKALKDSLKNKNIIYKDIANEANIFLIKDLFINRMKDIFIFTSDINIDYQIDDIYRAIINVYEDWKSKLKELNEYSEYFETFFKYSKDEKYKDYLKPAFEKLSLKKNSFLFQHIYESNKKKIKKIKDELLLLSSSYSDFKNAIKIIDKNPDHILEY